MSIAELKKQKKKEANHLYYIRHKDQICARSTAQHLQRKMKAKKINH